MIRDCSSNSIISPQSGMTLNCLGAAMMIFSVHHFPCHPFCDKALLGGWLVGWLIGRCWTLFALSSLRYVSYSCVWFIFRMLSAVVLKLVSRIPLI